MKLQFYIDYHTVFGEELVLNLMLKNEDGDSTIRPYRMATVDGYDWHCNVDLPGVRCEETVGYYYAVEREGCVTRREWTTVLHMLRVDAPLGRLYRIYDHWIDAPEDAHRYTSAFTECLIRKAVPNRTPAASFARTVRLVVRAPQLSAGQQLAVTGNVDVLGQWNAAQSVGMNQQQSNEWAVDLDADRIGGRIAFKFIAIGGQQPDDLIWEQGENREMDVPEMNRGEVYVYNLPQVAMPTTEIRVAGTLIPVFALRSAGSFGVGDFGDLKSMIDFVSVSGQHVLQVLPVNDTTATHTQADSYPYSCISIFALHPQYCDLRQLPEPKDQSTRERYAALQTELNALPKIDYERVNAAKWAYLKLIFEQEGRRIMATKAYRTFFKDAEQWLVPYARYCQLRDMYGTPDFNRWPEHRTWNEAEREQLTSTRSRAYRDVALHYFVQYVLHAQLTAAHRYARSRQVILKGDIPIGVCRHGCDTWMEPKYFCMDGQAGAPPDSFAANGQNWGFPTYNWDAMLKDHCAWWVRRFRNMAEFFDAYRIDHVLGFFRIWQIPISSVHGLIGQFAPALPLSKEEIAGYGLHFEEELFTQPFIRDEVLNALFEEDARAVSDTWLDRLPDGTYKLKAAYGTQRKIAAAFDGKDDKKTRKLCNALMTLADEVLFVRDATHPELFHPRIAAQSSFIYKSLSAADQAAFNRLYDDYYYRRHNRFWYGEAMKKLPELVQATHMLVCAEDLGMVPECVAWVMHRLQILTLEVQFMPKDPAVRFAQLSRNPYLSVDTLSTHDMPTLRQWWDEDAERAGAYYASVLHRDGAAPHPLPGKLARDIVAQHLASPSMLCILSLQDWLATAERLRLPDPNAERINIPADPKHYWCYRMHLTIEDMMANKAFVADLSELIEQAGRATKSSRKI